MKSVVEKHILMPKHALCSDAEKEKILEKYNATLHEMPKIKANDPAIADLKVKNGDMVKVERDEPLIGKTLFYRVVING